VASAGTLDVLIPPSVLIAIYAIVAEQSLVKLYAAAFIPGFVLAGLYCRAVWIVAGIKPHWIPKGRRCRSRCGCGLARHVEARRAVLLCGVRHLLGWFSPTKPPPWRRCRDRDRVCSPGRWDGAI
jgi:TRAP-type mannitol/chloroaromatic compound transport system permease large subunit